MNVEHPPIPALRSTSMLDSAGTIVSEMHNCSREGEREEMERDSVEDITLARKPDVCVVQYLLLILPLLVYIDFLQDGQLDS